MKKALSILSIVLCLISLEATAALRADVVSDRDLAVEGETWALQFSTGLIDGKAKEYVFTYDEALGGGRYKLSQLDWDIKRVVMMGGNLTLRERRGTINIGLWKAISEGAGGHIKDYDWLNPESSHWTEYSDSSSDVTDAIIFDINGGWEFMHDVFGFNARVLFGYKMDFWKWDASGGHALYSWLDYETYHFEDDTILKYKQKIHIPYFGGSADWAYGGFMVSAYCTYSPFVRIHTRDNHILRTLTISDKFRDGEMLATGASAKYTFDSGWFLTAAVDFQKVNLIIGDATYNQYVPEQDVLVTQSIKNYGGASNRTLALSLGVGKSF